MYAHFRSSDSLAKERLSKYKTIQASSSPQYLANSSVCQSQSNVSVNVVNHSSKRKHPSNADPEKWFSDEREDDDDDVVELVQGVFTKSTDKSKSQECC